MRRAQALGFFDFFVNGVKAFVGTIEVDGG